MNAIEKAGVPSSEISLVANKHVGSDNIRRCRRRGVLEGRLRCRRRRRGRRRCGGLLAGLGLLAIPGLGPVVAVGWLASLAVGAAAGAAAGGLVGALVSAGTPDDHAHVYSESVRRGGTLVSARVDDSAAVRIQAILDGYKPIDPVIRGAEYRKDGWKAFDPKAPAYKPNETELERMRREAA